MCLNLVSNGQSDWYLPTMQELFMLWNNYYTVVMTLKRLPGASELQPVRYYSSNEENNSTAWTFNFKVGAAYSTIKTNANLVRPIRAF